MSPRSAKPVPTGPVASPRLSVILPHTEFELTGAALREAARMAHGLDARVTVLAVQLVPFPEPLDPTRGCPALDELLAMAEAAEAPVTINIVYSRDWETACEQVLGQGSLVVIAVRKGWRRTREERLAEYLVRAGHNVTTIPA